MSPVSQTVLCDGRSRARTYIVSVRGRHFMGCHSPYVTQPGRADFSAPFFCLLFFGKDKEK
ncbi:hypothetical protein P3T16_003016 [Paraburkholderia sp. GAS42]